MPSALDIVLEAAQRRATELLNQASKYESLNQPSVAQLTLDEHYYPLADAIAEVRGEPFPTPRDRQVGRALREED